MIRLHIVVEGQTEETFVNRLLTPHLGQFNIVTDARPVETSRQKAKINREAKIYRGGLGGTYAKARKDITLWLKEDSNADSYLTTMFDLFRLPPDFPGFDQAAKQPDPYQRVVYLEQSLEQDIQHQRFMPYIQLHEFEAILFADPSKFDWEFINHDQAIQKLTKLSAEVASPELINDTVSPSMQIIDVIPEYEGRKASAGPVIAEKVGLVNIRAKCKHFDDWLTRLEGLGQK